MTPYEPLHPSSMAEIRALYRLHGAARLRAALAELEAQDRAPIDRTVPPPPRRPHPDRFACPACWDRLTPRTTGADGQPTYCDTCDREVAVCQDCHAPYVPTGDGYLGTCAECSRRVENQQEFRR